ncbi:TPA: hypothetical protein ACHU7U_001990 [Streptococcus suis]
MKKIINLFVLLISILLQFPTGNMNVYAVENDSTVVEKISSTDEHLVEFISHGASEYEPGTFRMTLKVGEKGQILRPQNSPLKDFRYSFEMTVRDPSIISFDEQGNWEALKVGKTEVIPNFPSGDSIQAKKFQEELAKSPLKLIVNEVKVGWEVTVVEADFFDGRPMYRFYNPNNKEHFYTGSVDERDFLIKIGWGSYEGISWLSPASGQAVYRLYNPILKDHHYTIDTHEVDVLTSQYNWINEGIAWYSGGDTHVHRLFHSGLTSGSHHYTTDENEVKILQERGWKYEGIAWYGK